MLRLRFDDFSRATRSHTLRRPTAQTGAVLAAARGLLASVTGMIERDGLTLVGLSVGNLADVGSLQLELPLVPERGLDLDHALDDVRERFGTTAVTRAVLLGRDTGLSMPMLPD
jgi:DNA polymerase IV